MSKRKTKRPYWQHTPCPPWCGSPHRDGDHPDDRVHRSEWDKVIPLTLSKSVRLPHEYGFDDPVELLVWTEQQYREAEARVQVVQEPTPGSRPIDLTLAEARKLGRALLRAVELAEGGERR
jgi:hypothetical protein